MWVDERASTEGRVGWRVSWFSLGWTGWTGWTVRGEWNGGGGRGRGRGRGRTWTQTKTRATGTGRSSAEGNPGGGRAIAHWLGRLCFACRSSPSLRAILACPLACLAHRASPLSPSTRPALACRKPSHHAPLSPFHPAASLGPDLSFLLVSTVPCPSTSSRETLFAVPSPSAGMASDCPVSSH